MSIDKAKQLEANIKDLLHYYEIFLKDGNSLLRTSELDGFKHIYKLSFDGKHSQITAGSWDVIDFLGLDLKSNTIFLKSNFINFLYKWSLFCFDELTVFNNFYSMTTTKKSDSVASRCSNFIHYI